MPSDNVKYSTITVTPAPHIHSGADFSKVMYSVILALLPAALFSIYMYKMDALRVMALAVAASMAAEYIFQRMFGKAITINDGSAIVSGVLLAFILPPSVPWWLVVTASFVSMLVGKHIFGGKGYNPFNPVLIGWAAIRLSWDSYINFDYAMINYHVPFSLEYPLSVLKKAGAAGVDKFALLDLFLGKQAGGLGAAVIFLILLGGLFLILRGVISWRIPVSFLAGVAIMALVFWLVDSGKYANPLFHIVTGNVMIGAFFLSTDYSSSPVNKTAMVLYGLGCGIFTVLFRVWSVYPDGVVFAVLLMNIMNPLLDRIRPKVPGKVK